MTTRVNHNESWYPETERLIAAFWRAKNRLARLQAKEQSLLTSLDILNIRLREFRRVPGITAKYGITAGGARTGDVDYSALMVEYESMVDRLALEILGINRRLLSVQCRINSIREWLAPIEEAMNKLSDEEYSLTEQRYVYRRSNYQIAVLLYSSEWRIRSMKNRIIHRIAEWLGKKPVRSGPSSNKNNPPSQKPRNIP